MTALSGEWRLEALRMDALRGQAEAVPCDREEARWVARAQAGDAAGQRWLLERYRVRMVRLAAHVLRGEADAEDVAQEAFVQAFRHLGALRGDGAGFAPWLRRIVVRRCLDHLRRPSRGREVPAEQAREQHVDDGAAGTDTRLLVETLLDRLAPALRAALVLRECEGMGYDEIADVLRVPVGTVRSRLHAARAQFRALWLAAEQEGGTDV